MEGGYRMYSRFLSGEEAAHWRGVVEARPELFLAVGGKGGLNLPFSVVGGRQVRQHLPDVLDLMKTRLWETAQEAAGRPLAPIQDPERALRIQHYRGKNEGFRWHYDLSQYSALLTLVNTNGGATEVISPRLSRSLTPLYYLLYPLRQVFSVARCQRIVSEAGDLLILHGSAALHRATAQQDQGERLVLVATFDPVGQRPTPLRDWVARRFNY